MTSKSPAKRLLLINRDFQLRYARLALLVGAGSTVLTLVLILYPLFQFRILRFPDFLPTPFLIGIAAASLVNFVLVTSLSIVVTHRIAGPMYSLVRHIRQLQNGRFPGELKVRDGDELRYLVRNFNEMLESLRRLAVEDRDSVMQASESLQAGHQDDALNHLEALQNRLNARLVLEKDVMQ